MGSGGELDLGSVVDPAVLTENPYELYWLWGKSQPSRGCCPKMTSDEAKESRDFTEDVELGRYHIGSRGQ